MKKQILTLSTLAFASFGCTESVSKNADARILTMGDSMLAAHSLSGQSVSHVLEKELSQSVVDRSVMGARVIYNLPISGSAGFNIPAQFRKGDWDWVVLNGGGNDLWFGCGCHGCDRKINKLISEDGTTGEIPKLINKLRSTGAQVVYVGYLRSPGVGSPIESCKDDGDVMEARIAKLAERDDGVHFASNQDLVPHGDRTYHGFDMIHPSVKGSTAIAQRVAEIIKQ